MLLGCVTLGKLLGLSGLQFPCGQSGIDASTRLTDCQEERTVQVECLSEFLAHNGAVVD